MRLNIFFLLILLIHSCSTSSDEGKFKNAIYFDYLSDYPNLSQNTFFNLDEAFLCSQKSNKEIIILFTSFGLHSNLKNNIPEWKILCNETIKHKIEKNYVLCLLFVDDRTKIEARNYHSNFTNNHYETFGEMWSEIEIEKFNSNVCPLFIKMDSKNIVAYKGKFEDYSNILEFIQ
jgi:hypothetical protein